MWDDEAPRGFQEADLELEEFEAQAAREYSSNELDRGIDEREAALYESMDQLDDVEDVDPFAGLPFGEQQREVDWLESRFDSSYELDPPEYDGPWDES